MARLLLVRHGATEFNSARRFMGHSDIELSDQGIRQAERLRLHLADEKIDAAYSSDLKRTLATAEEICRDRPLDIITCPELRELNYGACEGLTFGEIASQHPRVAELCRSFTTELAFPEGESFEGFLDRACAFQPRLHRHGPDQTVLITSHSGPLKVLLCRLLDLDPVHWLKFGVDTGSLSIVQTFPTGALLVRLNDTSHLRETA